MSLVDIHICKKTCNICNLVYICKTQQDPYKYNGSGTEWKKHNESCGINHTTEILFTSSDKEKVRKFCIEYGSKINPKYWTKPEYANMIMEGGGYDNSGQSNPNFKHGRAVGWKSDKSIQKENDRIRNAEYHAKNRDKELARMRAYYHRKKLEKNG